MLYYSQDNVANFVRACVLHDNQVLLGYKTRGFGSNKWDGFGGKVEKDKLLLDGAKRELFEESGLKAANLQKLGVLKYSDIIKKQVRIVHLFICREYQGSEQSSGEKNPIHWYSCEDVPYEEMWPDAKKWMPSIFQEKTFFYDCFYNEDNIVKEFFSYLTT